MNEMKKFTLLLQSKNGMKIVGLFALAVVAVIMIYVLDDSATSTQSVLAKSESQVSGDFASILSSMDGVGQTKVFVTYISGDINDVKGVIIVAEGGGELDVILRLQNAAATVYGIDVEQIEVFKMKGAPYNESNNTK